MAQTIRIECIFVNKRHNGSAICIQDGSTEPSPIAGGTPIPKDYWIELRHIKDQDFDSINDLHRGERIEIFIPEWLALQKGMI